MVSSTLKRSAAAGAAFGLGGASLFGASSAMAADVELECALPDAYVIGGVCEILFTEAGETVSVTFPESLGKVSAIVVGAGGGGAATTDYGYAAYGGGGGQVVYVDEVPLGAELEIVVGAGGAGDTGWSTSPHPDSADGESSFLGEVEALGGKGIHFADPSIDEVNSGASWEATTAEDAGDADLFFMDQDGPYAWWFTDLDENYYLGGGAGTDGDGEAEAGGPGLDQSEVPDVDAALFPAAADFGFGFGAGGTAAVIAGEQPEPELVSAEVRAADVVEEPTVIQNSGQGGNGYLLYDEDFDPELPPYTGFVLDEEVAVDGQDGIVIVHFAATEVEVEEDEELAPTGADAGAALAAGGVAALGGAALVAAASRRRRTA